MIDVRVFGSQWSSNEPGHCVAAQLDEEMSRPKGAVIQIISPEHEDMAVLLDDPDAVGALADALRRIERRMRETMVKR